VAGKIVPRVSNANAMTVIKNINLKLVIKNAQNAAEGSRDIQILMMQAV